MPSRACGLIRRPLRGISEARPEPPHTGLQHVSTLASWIQGFGGGGLGGSAGVGPLWRKVFQGCFLSGPLSCRSSFCLTRPFPHPHSSLLNCVIIFKQINSIAEFFLS